MLEAAVVGQPDADGLIKPKAFVVLQDGAGDRRGDAARAAEGAREGAHRRLEIPALDRVRRQPAEDRDRQDPALPAARRGDAIGRLALDGRGWKPPGGARRRTPRRRWCCCTRGWAASALWRDFPARLAAATGCGVFAYSRFGYGQSDPLPLPWPLTYMHDEARDVLPRVLDARRHPPRVLVGHSDGASIAAIYAGGGPDVRACAASC